MSSVVASRYAKALFELGKETGTLESFTREIRAMADAYEASRELRDAIDNPLVPHPARKAILAELADRLSVGQLAKNAIMLLADRRRLRALPAIATRLSELADLDKGVVHAEVVTAAPLPESYFERLRQQIERMTGKRVVLDRREDPSLIAGVVTRIGDAVYDGSLRAKLESMRAALMPN